MPMNFLGLAWALEYFTIDEITNYLYQPSFQLFKIWGAGFNGSRSGSCIPGWTPVPLGYCTKCECLFLAWKGAGSWELGAWILGYASGCYL